MITHSYHKQGTKKKRPRGMPRGYPDNIPGFPRGRITVKTRQFSHFSPFPPCHNSTATAVLAPAPAPAPAELMTCSSSDARYSLRLVRLACGCEKGSALIDSPGCTNGSWTFFIGVLVRGETSESSPKKKNPKKRCALPQHYRTQGGLRVPCWCRQVWGRRVGLSCRLWASQLL